MNSGALVAVTGAAGGVGRATITHLHRAGYRVVAIDKRPVAPLDPPPQELLPYRYAVDITEWRAVHEVVNEIVATHGVPDIWVNNAAVGKWGPFDPEAFGSEREEMEVNYHGSLNCIRAILPHWQVRRRGHLVQVSSTAAMVHGPWMATYTASKAAIGSFIRALRIELEDEGIVISEVVPNVVDTELTRGSNRLYIPKIALIRPVLTPEQVAFAIRDTIEKQRREVRLPPLITPFYILSAVFPRVMDRLLSWGAGSRKQKGTDT